MKKPIDCEDFDGVVHADAVPSQLDIDRRIYTRTGDKGKTR